MKNSNNILIGLSSAAIGYWFGNKKKTTAFDLVSERGDGNRITYPIYRLTGKTKTALNTKEYENVLSNPAVPVTLVNMEFLNQFTTVGKIETNNL